MNTIKGNITIGNSTPAAGLKVIAYSQTLHEEKALATATTDHNGNYQLSYSSPHSLNIVIRVFNPKGRKPVASTKTKLKCSESFSADLIVGSKVFKGINRFESIECTIEPYLGEMCITDLSNDQLEMLACESGVPLGDIQNYLKAQFYSKDQALSAEVLFVLLIQQLEVDADSLFKLSRERLMHLLAKAWQDHIICKSNSTRIMKELRAHEKLSMNHQLKRTTFSSATTIGDLWKIARPNPAQFAKIGDALRTSAGNTRDFWERLKCDATVKPIATKLELLASLNSLTFGNLPLIKKLNSNKAVASLEDLAGWTLDQWERAIGNTDIPTEIEGKPAERKRMYATSMKRMTDYLYPSRNIKVSMLKDKSIGSGLRADYNTFFTKNPDFSFETGDLQTYLNNNSDAMSGVRDQKGLKQDLERSIRLVRLTPEMDRYDNVERLRGLNIHSAEDITRDGYDTFLTNFLTVGGTAMYAELIFGLAQIIVSMVGTLVMELWFDVSVIPYVLDTGMKNDPIWANLFGSEDYCTCKHCESVYGPAAYLTDSLHFLENRKLPGGGTVYQELNRRRPDIKHILLNCENSHTAMPYIDLVNEILELAAVQTANASERNLYQTTHTTAELMASPEHLRSAAYGILKTAEYPWSMPFDFYNQLGKTYLQHLGVSHHKLVTLFPSDESLSKRQTKAILCLNETDWDRLIGNDYTQREKELWGLIGGEKIKDIESIEFFLRKSQLDLKDLKELVNSRFVDPALELRLKYPDPCSLVGAKIENLKSAHRKRMIQVVRLHQKLKVAIRTVDHILIALQATSITSEVLNNISRLTHWHQSHSIPYSELVSWVGKMPTAYPRDAEQHKEEYERLFLSFTEGKDKDVRQKFLLRADKRALINESRVITGNSNNATSLRTYILGALVLTSDELNTIISILPSNKLSLANLSIIYGYHSISRALSVSITELVLLEEIVETESDDRINKIEGIMDFLKLVGKFSLSMDQLLLLFNKESKLRLTPERKTEILQEIREGLWKFNHQGQEEGEESQVAPLTQEAFIYEKLSIVFDIDRNHIIKLLELSEDGDSYLMHSDGIQTPYLTHLLHNDFVNPELPQEIISINQFPELEALCELLNRIGQLFNVLRLEGHHFSSLLSANGKVTALDLNKLSAAEDMFNPFVRLLKINQIVEETSGTDVNLFDLLASNSNSSAFWQNMLQQLFGYTGISGLTAALGLAPNDYNTPQNYLNILSTIALEAHLGIKIADFSKAGKFQWARSVLEEEQVMEIIQVSKAKYGEEQWQNVTKQLRDAIREEQRDALLSYVMVNKFDAFSGRLDTPEKLYAHLLIDVEMSSCTVTSRIKLALSSVQLFVQRCLMNLEENVNLKNISQTERDEWEEWAWRKNYRVWEANRKVYLYPENWLEPEWRDNKTVFFKELETELLQGDLNDVNTEKAYVNYLAKLNSVSNMEIMATCHGEEVDGQLSGYYIFGRTHGRPETLYFRKYILDTGAFSSWEIIEIDFEGDYLIPHMHKGKLHLFWPQLIEKGRSGEEKDNGYGDPVAYWEAYMAWTKYQNGEWSPKKVTKDYVLTENYWRHQYGTSEFLTMSYYLYDAGVIKSYWGSYDWHAQAFRYDQVGLFDFTEAQPAVTSEEHYDDFYHFHINQNVPIQYDSNRIHVDGEHHLGEPVLIHDLKIIDELQEKLTFVPPVANGEVWHSGVPFVVQNRKFSALFNPNGSEYNIIPLQANLYPNLNNDISSYGLTSDKVMRSWTVYQSETITIQNETDFKPGVFVNANKVTQPLNFLKEPAFAQYSWELFFHIPMHIANKLRVDQKFEQAQRWFHYVFNPTSSEDEESPRKFWIFKPFREYACSEEDGTPCNIQELMRIVNDEHYVNGFQTFENTIHEWEQNPFSPHTVARTRVIAYMKWVVMRYIDNLIEWADQLFRRDSIESLNEATQLYMLAWNILGGKPREINEKERPDRSYEQIHDDLDEFSNVLITLENKLSNILAQAAANKKVREIELADPMGITVMGYLGQGGQKVEMAAGSPIMNLPEAAKARNYTKKPIKTIDEIAKPDKPPYMRKPNKGQRVVEQKALYFCIPQNQKLLGYWDLIQDRFFKLRNCLNIEGVYRQLPLYEPPIDPALLIKAKAAGLSIADALSSEYDTKSHYRFSVLLQKAIDYANDVRAFGSSLLAALEKRDNEKLAALRSQHDLALLEAGIEIRKEQINELKASNAALNYSLQNVELKKNYYADKEFLSPMEKEQQDLLSCANTLQIIGQSTAMAASIAHKIPNFDVGYSGWGGHMTTNVGGVTVGSILEMAAEAFSLSANIKNMQAVEVGQMATFKRRQEEWDFHESAASIELKQVEKQVLAAEIRMEVARHELSNHRLQVESKRDQLAVIRDKFTNTDLYDWMVGQLKTLYFQSYQMAFDMAKKAEKALANEFGIGGANDPESFIQFGYWDNLKEGLLSGEKLHHDLKRMEMIFMQRNKRKHEVSQTFSLAITNPEELVRLRATGTCDFTIPEVLLDMAYPKQGNRKIKSVSMSIPSVTGPYTGVQATLSNAASSSKISTSSGQNDNGLFQFNFNDERYLPFEGTNPASNWTIEMNDTFRAFDYNTISDVLLHINYTAHDLPDKSGELLAAVQGIDLNRFFSVKSAFANEWFRAKNDGTPLSLLITKDMLPFVFHNMQVAASGGQPVKHVSVPLPTEINPGSWNNVAVAEEGDNWRVEMDINLENIDDLLMVFSYEVQAL